MISVAAAVIILNGRVLLCRRAPGEKLEGYWEFPGGKKEPGEGLKQCLERELFEELGIETRADEEIGRSRYRYGHGEIELTGFLTRLIGEHRQDALNLTVHDRAEWIAPEKLAGYRLAPADIPLVENIISLMEKADE